MNSSTIHSQIQQKVETEQKTNEIKAENIEKKCKRKNRNKIRRRRKNRSLKSNNNQPLNLSTHQPLKTNKKVKQWHRTKHDETYENYSRNNKYFENENEIDFYEYNSYQPSLNTDIVNIDISHERETISSSLSFSPPTINKRSPLSRGSSPSLSISGCSVSPVKPPMINGLKIHKNENSLENKISSKTNKNEENIKIKVVGIENNNNSSLNSTVNEFIPDQPYIQPYHPLICSPNSTLASVPEHAIQSFPIQFIASSSSTASLPMYPPSTNIVINNDITNANTNIRNMNLMNQQIFQFPSATTLMNIQPMHAPFNPLLTHSSSVASVMNSIPQPLQRSCTDPLYYTSNPLPASLLDSLLPMIVQKSIPPPPETHTSEYFRQKMANAQHVNESSVVDYGMYGNMNYIPPPHPNILASRSWNNGQFVHQPAYIFPIQPPPQTIGPIFIPSQVTDESVPIVIPQRITNAAAAVPLHVQGPGLMPINSSVNGTLVNIQAHSVPGVDPGLYWYHPRPDSTAVLYPVHPTIVDTGANHRVFNGEEKKPTVPSNLQ